MTISDFDDKYSWILLSSLGEGGADLYNAMFVRKLAYSSVADAIVRAPCAGCFSSI